MVSMLIFSFEALAQEQIVTGKVLDTQLKEGMPGVNVQVKGSTVGTITDFDGNYSIKVNSPKSVLVFTFIGFSTQEVTVGNKTVINVEMKEDAQALEEVVVVGYGTARKGDLTGALTMVQHVKETLLVLLPLCVRMRTMLPKQHHWIICCQVRLQDLWLAQHHQQ